jgi:hypothetical protein
MDSPPYHYYPHYHPTIINIHTLLKPQTYQPTSINTTHHSPFASYTPLYHQPPKIPTSVIHQNEFSNPPSTLTPSYHTPSVSSTDIGSLLNQISHSQELLKHSFSVFANEVSLLKTTLTLFFTHDTPLANPNNLRTHNGYHYQDPSHTQQQPPPSLHNTPHPILTTVPSPFNNTHSTPKQNCFSPVPSHHRHQPKFVLQFSNSGEMSETTTTTTITNKESVADRKIIPTVHEHEFVVTTKLVEPEINEREEPKELIVDDGNFTFPTVDSIPHVENKFVSAAIVANDKSTAYTAKRCVPDSLYLSYSNVDKYFFKTTTSSPEKKVVRVVAVTETHQKQPLCIVELTDISIHIFDPGGTLTFAVCYTTRRRQIRHFRSYYIFPMTAPSPSHRVFVSLLSFVWEPWDRGKKNWNCKNNFPAPAAYLASV